MSDNSIPQTGQQRERENNKETKQDKTPSRPPADFTRCNHH